MATRYGLDAPVFEPRWGTRFSAPVRIGPEAPSLLYNGYRVSFPGVNCPGSGVKHPTLSVSEVKKKTE